MGQLDKGGVDSFDAECCEMRERSGRERETGGGSVEM